MTRAGTLGELRASGWETRTCTRNEVEGAEPLASQPLARSSPRVPARVIVELWGKERKENRRSRLTFQWNSGAYQRDTPRQPVTLEAERPRAATPRGVQHGGRAGRSDTGRQSGGVEARKGFDVQRLLLCRAQRHLPRRRRLGFPVGHGVLGLGLVLHGASVFFSGSDWVKRWEHRGEFEKELGRQAADTTSSGPTSSGAPPPPTSPPAVDATQPGATQQRAEAQRRSPPEPGARRVRRHPRARGVPQYIAEGDLHQRFVERACSTTPTCWTTSPSRVTRVFVPRLHGHRRTGADTPTGSALSRSSAIAVPSSSSTVLLTSATCGSTPTTWAPPRATSSARVRDHRPAAAGRRARARGGGRVPCASPTARPSSSSRASSPIGTTSIRTGTRVGRWPRTRVETGPVRLARLRCVCIEATEERGRLLLDLTLDAAGSAGDGEPPP